jgi:hypothetical protein
MIAAPEQQCDLFAARPAADDSASWLEKLLFESKCWMSAKDIQLTTHGRVIDREIRQLASDSCKIISGQKGYKHIAHATAEEVNHAANWMESQAKKMSDRACALRREAHKIFG